MQPEDKKINKLRIEHRYLYNRILVKSIVHALLGLSILLLPPESTRNGRLTILNYIMDFRVFGIIFLACGLTLLILLAIRSESYNIIRYALVFTGSYSLLWLIALFVSVVTNNPSALSVTILWGYFTANQFIVALDPSWNGIKIARHVKYPNE